MSVRFSVVNYITNYPSNSGHTNLSLAAALCKPEASVRRATHCAVELGQLLRVDRKGWFEFKAVPVPAPESLPV